MKEILDFLMELKTNNNREWFAAHKDECLRVKEKTEALATRLIAGVASFDPRAAMLTAADCTYRIYRDTRFSQDKTPYKTHVGIFINPPYGKKSNRMGYYLHKDFVTSHRLSQKEVCSNHLPDKVAGLFRIAKPFNDFINYTIDENPV